VTNLTISNFVDNQFPGYFDDEQPVLKSFVGAYYEWLEVTNRYSANFNPVSNVTFTIGKNILSVANTEQQGLIVESSNTSLVFIGDMELSANSKIVAVTEIDTTVTGTVGTTANSRILIGDGTSFLTEFAVDEGIHFNGKVWFIDSIRSAEELVLKEEMDETAEDLVYSRYVISKPVTIESIWTTPNSGAMTRRLPVDADVDTALPQFVKYFKNKYLNPLPNSTQVDSRFLVKHIQDLYRSKGSLRAYELLFRILFNEDVNVFIPSRYLFATSEAKWHVPKYIEVSDTPDLNKFINTRIYSSSRSAQATVEEVFKKNVGGKIVAGMVLSNILGTFHYGEQVLSLEVPEITIDNAPIIFGSLSSATITNGGTGFDVGDEVNIGGSGVGGKAIVTSIANSTGKVAFELKDGGYGYTMNASIIVDSTGTGGSGATFSIGDLTNKEILSVSTDVISDYAGTQLDNISNTFLVHLTGVSGTFSVSENVKSTANVVPLDVSVISGTLQQGETVSNSSLTATVGISDGSYLELISNSAVLSTGLVLVGGTSGASVAINTVFATRVVECNGVITSISGANLTVSNCYFFSGAYKGVLSTSVSAAGQGYANGEIVTFTGGSGSGARGFIVTNNTGNVSSVEMQVYGNSYTSAPTPVITTVAGSGATLSASVGQLGGYPYPGVKFIGQTSAANGTISTVSRLSNWGFPAVNIPDVENLDTTVGGTLTFETLEVGTIRYITGVNPGDGYATPPTVTVVDDVIYNIGLPDGQGGIKGADAIVNASAGFANGIATSIKIIDSGYGYAPSELLTMTNANNISGIEADSIVDAHGTSKGYWLNRKSFTSDASYIQDSYYWQRFSYDIQVPREFETYMKYVKELIHPAGFKMFGSYRKNTVLDSESTIAETSILQV
jgi:hypothetical protein